MSAHEVAVAQPWVEGSGVPMTDERDNDAVSAITFCGASGMQGKGNPGVEHKVSGAGRVRPIE